MTAKGRGDGALELGFVDPQLKFIPGSLPGASRRWLHIDQEGHARAVEVEKHRLVLDLCIRYRDLMQLDPSLPIPYPSALFIREKALVVNLETVRMIICANQCYVLSVPKEGVENMATLPSPSNPFVRELCRVLRGGADSRMGLAMFDRPSFDYGMPYELRALEVALAAATRVLDAEVLELEQEAYPAVDRLAVQVSRKVLEDVRSVKATMNRLIGRVQRVKSELEDVLGDDADMQDMYLGRRAALDGEDLPPHPPYPEAGSPRHSKTSGNLVSLDAEESAMLPASPPRHAASSGALLGLGAGPPASPSPWAPTLPRGRARGGGVKGEGEGEGWASPRAAARWTGVASHAEERARLESSPSSRSLSRQRQRGRGSKSKGQREGGRQQQQQQQQGRQPQSPGGGRARQSIFRPSMVVRTVRRLRSKRDSRGRGGHGSLPPQAEEESGSSIPGSPSSSSSSSSSSSGGRSESGDEDESSERGSVIEETVQEMPGVPIVDPHEIEEAEDLLEAYFMQVDYLMRRLMLLKERIDDTEDLVNIEMDHRRNELVALDLLVTCITLSFTFVAMVAGVFGMNLYNSRWEDNEVAFLWIIVLTSLVGALLLVVILLYIRKRRLMFISTV